MAGFTRMIVRLARNPEAGFPDGDPRYGYVIVAPLQADGHLDAAAWQAHKADCTVRRFSPDPDDTADGWLTHQGGKWRVRYDEESEGPDDSFDHLGDHRLFVGDYVTITSRGQALVYQVSTEDDA